MTRTVLLLSCLALTACARDARYRPDGVEPTRTNELFDASFDEVYDAAWLSAEKLGFQVIAHDRRQGTFRLGGGFEVQATVRDDRAMLRSELSDSTALYAQVKSLLEAWKTTPEFDYLKVGHAVATVGVRLPLPSEWNVIELRTDRRWFRLQRHKRAPEGANPTLLVELDRRRPLASNQALMQQAAELAIAGAKELLVPDDLPRAAVMNGTGAAALTGWTQATLINAEPFDLDSLSFVTETHAWTIRVAGACPRPITTENGPDQVCLKALRSVFDGARQMGDRAE